MSNAQAFTSEALPLSEQVVLVTGSGRGLGAAIAKAFAPEESALVINYRYSAETAEELAEAIRARGGRAMAVEADVTDSRAVDAMFEAAVAEFGAPVSTVVNNALVDFSFNGDERQPAAPRPITAAEPAATTGGRCRRAMSDRTGSKVFGVYVIVRPFVVWLACQEVVTAACAGTVVVATAPAATWSVRPSRVSVCSSAV